MRVRISREARDDLEAIGDFIAEDSPVRAERFVDELKAACLALASYPQRYPIIRTLRNAEFRQRVFGNYRIVYLLRADLVYVARILHTARDDERIPFPEG